MNTRFALALVPLGLAAVAVATIGLVLAQSGTPYAITRSAFTGGGVGLQSGGPLRMEAAVGEGLTGFTGGTGYAVQLGVLGDTGSDPPGSPTPTATASPSPSPSPSPGVRTVRGRFPMLANDGPQQ